MKLHIAMCDDETPELEYLQKKVSDWAKKSRHQLRISAFKSAEAFMFAFDTDKTFDILLLDIQMERMDGISLAKRLRERDDRLQIVFITGYPDYMSEGYEVSALHYLIKPVNADKLSDVLNKACKKLSFSARTVLLRTVEGNIRIPVDDILYAEVFSHSVSLYTTREVHQIRLTMNQLEKELGEGFFRCHRSYIAGLKHVRKVSRTIMQLDNGKELPVSRNLYDRANQAFIIYNWGDEQ